MTELLAIALGGAAGALARFGLSQAADATFGVDFPYGILIVNVLGSLAIGIVFVLLVEKTAAHGLLRSVLMVGFLGAFTTFSTFSLQTLALLEEGRLMAAALYTFGSVALCVIATGIGIAVTRAAV